MPSFRILDQFPAFLGPDGRPVVGGELRFYESGTTTPKDVYADPGMTVNNGSTVQIGSDGRTVVDVWGDGAYRVRLYAANGTLVAEADDVEIPGGAAANIPVPEAGEFLTGDGTQFLTQTLLLLPDPTGQDGKMVVASGSGYILQSIPEPEPPPEPDISDGANFLQIMDYRIQWGTGSAPATGTDRTSASITFPVAFDAPPHYVGVMVTSTNITGHSLVAIAVTGITANGCTVTFDNADRHYQGSSKIVNPVPFMWKAEGKKSVA